MGEGSAILVLDIELTLPYMEIWDDDEEEKIIALRMM